MSRGGPTLVPSLPGTTWSEERRREHLFENNIKVAAFLGDARVVFTLGLKL